MGIDLYTGLKGIKLKEGFMAEAGSAVSVFSACGLTEEVVEGLARLSGFLKRAAGKIKPLPFLAYFCLQAIKGTVSTNDLAAAIESGTGASASRQAYWLRINEACQTFFQAVLGVVIERKVDPVPPAVGTLFKRILLHDSTVVQLPAKLFGAFSGVKNGTAVAACNARIQNVYELLSGRFLHFSIDPYSKNDLLAAPEIPVQPGDLVLRDRGYFVLSTIAKHKAIGVDTISRYKHKTTLYDKETRKPIDLLDMLKRRGKVDQIVLAGKDMQLRLRLVAVPVPEEVANLRRMKAKKEVRGHNPSAEILELMSWSIFVLTVEDPSLTPTMIMQLYGLRWRIENIFKTWKSSFNFDKIHQVSEVQLQVLLTARLIMIVIAYQRAFLPLCQTILRRSQKQLSLMKFMRYISQNTAWFKTGPFRVTLSG
jgi:Transposase DDE domain